MQQWKSFKICYDYTACMWNHNKPCLFHEWHIEVCTLPYESVEGHAVIRMDGRVHAPEYILQRKHFHSGEICILNMICQVITRCSLFTQVQLSANRYTRIAALLAASSLFASQHMSKKLSAILTLELCNLYNYIKLKCCLFVCLSVHPHSMSRRYLGYFGLDRLVHVIAVVSGMSKFVF